MDSIKSVQSLLSMLERTVRFDNKEFKLINPEESYTDWEHNEEGHVLKVYNTTGQKQIVTNLTYNSNGVDNMVTLVDGQEKGHRSFTYDDKGRIIKEESDLEIITRTYDDENETYEIETKDIENETITIEKFAKEHDINFVDTAEYSAYNSEDMDIYKKLSENVFKADDDKLPICKEDWLYDYDEETFRVIISIRSITDDQLTVVSDSKYSMYKDATLEIIKNVQNEKGIYEERRTVNTYDDDLEKLLHVDFYIDNKLDGSIDYTYSKEGDVEVEEITGGTTIRKFVDEDGVYHEDTVVVLNGDTYSNNFRLAKDEYSIYLMVPTSSDMIESFEIHSRDINVIAYNGNLISAKFNVGNVYYEYQVEKNRINCYASAEVHDTEDNDKLYHQDEVNFKLSPDKTDDITEYISSILKECIEGNEILKILFNKGGFGYEKIGGISD